MSDQIKNIFIPHIHEDDEGLTKLKELAANHGMLLRDHQSHLINPTMLKMKNTSSRRY